MAYADEQSYEEMISALQTYVSQVEEECGVMESAGNDCVDNTDGDPAASTSNEKAPAMRREDSVRNRIYSRNYCGTSTRT